MICGNSLPLPAPAEQAESDEATGEERKSGREREPTAGHLKKATWPLTSKSLASICANQHVRTAHEIAWVRDTLGCLCQLGGARGQAQPDQARGRLFAAGAIRIETYDRANRPDRRPCGPLKQGLTRSNMVTGDQISPFSNLPGPAIWRSNEV
jgi:hypothetical protein